MQGKSNCHYFKGAHEKTSVGIRRPYLRVVGIQVETEGHSRVSVGESLSPEEEEVMQQLAGQQDIYNIFSRSIAPSIYGSTGTVTNCYIDVNAF